ncbi:hypothetical protein F2Q68_00016009 [Brassica cretica]|uniref:A20-type domain-containing protein n=1 Tax=Brassica cretica TaxID=69181 RepID=A0A8S9HLI0_BRACR|nr:hypothetical protein F2Q68_00016009 [Brassica cretica]
MAGYQIDHDNQSPPEGPELCVNNCGFFGSSATNNMCSKRHKAVLFQQEQGAKFASSMFGTSSPSNIIKETFTAALLVDAETKSVEPMVVSVQPSYVQDVAEVVALEAVAKPKGRTKPMYYLQ